MIVFIYIYKGGKLIFNYLRKMLWIVVFLKFKLNKVKIPNDFKSWGIPITSISLKGKVTIGSQFQMNNGLYNNMIGRQQPCFLVVNKECELTIGNNVGISATALICLCKITIEDNVRIGGGTVVYDSDFHSLNASERVALPEILNNINKKPVLIKKNVFIGAHSTILKGVTIGENSIIGASSVVTNSVPDNELWAGNPAKFVRKLN